jgi:maltooligosyltrehalose trehalohydrolase
VLFFNGEPGNTAVTFSEEEHWLWMRRGSIIVACSIAEQPRTIPIHSPGKLILTSDDGIVIAGDSVTLPPDSVAVIRTMTEH